MSLALISASLALQAHGELPEARSYDNDEGKATIGVDAQLPSAKSPFCGPNPASGSCCHSRRVKWGKINSLAIRRLRFVNHYELVWLKTILYFCNIITYRTLNGNIRYDKHLMTIAYE